MKRKIDQLFVATMTYEIGELIEPFVQYETFGRIDHHIILTRNKKLVYSSIDEDGTTRYYDYDTDEEVTEYQGKASYSTEAGAYSSLYYMYTQGGYPMPIPGIRADMEKQAQEEYKAKYGYFVPFTEYLYNRLGIKIKIINPKVARALLRFLPKQDKLVLSLDEEEAHEQLETYLHSGQVDKKQKVKSIQ